MPPAGISMVSLTLLSFCIVFISHSFYNNDVVSAVVVSRLPGFQGPLPFYLETGYVSVDEENGAELFYYFIESEGNPSEDPLILWLTGGPRCSAFSGLVFEIGPLKFVFEEYNGSLPKLVYHPYAWTKYANIIFLDSPVGTGFSYSRNPQGYEVGDFSSSKQVYKFLLQWFKDHPQFQENEFYVAADSYAGKVCPMVAYQISQGGAVGINPVINLKGYIIGNPRTGDNKIDLNARFPYAYGVGIISYDFFQLIEAKCHGQDYDNPITSECATCVDTFEKFLSEIQKPQILEPWCAKAITMPDLIDKNRRILNDEEYIRFAYPPPVPAIKCRSYVYYLAYYWANSNITREALGIKKGTKGEWERCAHGLPYSEDLASSVELHFNLTSRGYRALVYSGDHDMVLPFLGTQAWIRSLNFSVIEEWRSWHFGGQVAGYTITYSNKMTFATVKGAGHTAPEYKPQECLAMLQRWLSYKPL